MTTDQDFVQYVCDQIHGAGVITYRRMFGEYALYCDGKVVALLCDNQCFLKPTEAARALLPRVKEGLPYPGARPHLLLDEALEDGELLSRLIAVTAAQMPSPRQPAIGRAQKTSPRRRTKR
jgi:TfoX/Sxy family transcriptional regulator of competence genes